MHDSSWHVSKYACIGLAFLSPLYKIAMLTVHVWYQVITARRPDLDHYGGG